MTKEEAISAIYQGNLVECTREEYHSGLRTAIQEQAGKWIDGNDGLRAMIALDQVKRLDKLYPTI
jgi:hypothetical protein